MNALPGRVLGDVSQPGPLGAQNLSSVGVENVFKSSRRSRKRRRIVEASKPHDNADNALRDDENSSESPSCQGLRFSRKDWFVFEKIVEQNVGWPSVVEQFSERFEKQATEKALKCRLTRAQTKGISTLEAKELRLTSSIKPDIKQQGANILGKIVKGFEENSNNIDLSQILKDEAQGELTAKAYERSLLDRANSIEKLSGDAVWYSNFLATSSHLVHKSDIEKVRIQHFQAHPNVLLSFRRE